MKRLISLFATWPPAPYALAFLSAAVVLAAYLQALHYPFVMDDTIYISTNTKLAELHLLELWRLFTVAYNDMGELLPLRELSYWFDISLFGMNPSAFRIHNILLYLLCLPFIYAITAWTWRYFRSTDPAGAPWAAAAVTALFALHPSHTEAVVWIAGRKDVLSGMLALFALWLAVAARQEQRFSALHAAAALVALLAAMLSKATTVAVAPVIAMLWLLFWRDISGPKQHRLLLWPLAVMLLAAGCALMFAANSTAKIPFHFGMEWATRSLTVLGWLARLAVSSESRHFFYPVLDDPYLPAMITVGIAILAVSVVGAVGIFRKRSLEGFAIAVFLLLCIPSLQLIPYAPPSIVSDRFIFLAVWPAMLLVVSLAWRLQPLPRTILLLYIALSWTFPTVERTRDWRSFEAVVDADLRAYPGYYVPAVYKITIQLKQGLRRDAIETANSIANPELRDIMNRVITADHVVVTGNPQEAMNLLGQLGSELERLPVQATMNPHMASIQMRRRVLLKGQWNYLVEHFPDDVSVRYNAGLWMLEARDKDAAANLRAAVESHRLPESVRGSAFNYFGLALLRDGHIAEAELQLRAALEQTPPDLRAHCGLSEVYRKTGRVSEAARASDDCRNRSSSHEVAR